MIGITSNWDIGHIQGALIRARLVDVISPKLQSRPRGAVSLTFLAALAIGVVSLMMILNARTVMTLTLTSRAENQEKANAQAMAVIEEAKSKILADRQFGKNGEVVRIGDTDEDGNWAEVSFSPEAEFSSVNNLGEGAQKLGEGGVVLDPGMIQVVAVSQYRNARVVSYEIVMAPPLPFSLGSSGAVVAGGNSLIGGVESSGVLVDGLDRAGELIDGGVVANGGANSGLPAGLEKALTLADNVEVVGKAKTAGGAVVAPTVNMTRGSVEDITEAEALPQIDPREYDPVAKGWEHVTRTGATVDAAGVQVVTDANPIYGFHRFAGATRFEAPVKLNGGLVFVDGDVVLTKPLTGTGALVATGKVTISGGADIKADALAAVVAGGDLTVSGARGADGALSSQFTGLLYSGGNLTLNDTRTVGSAIAAGTASGGSVMSIQNSEFLASPEGQDVSIVIQDFVDAGDGTLGGLGGSRGGANYVLRPTVSAITEHPGFRDSQVSEETIAVSLLRIRYGSRTYSTLEEALAGIPASEHNRVKDSYRDAKNAVKLKVKSLRAQGETLQIVHFDLNEFLNVSDRLKASRPYYIED